MALDEGLSATVADLKPGDLVTNGPDSAVFIQSAQHPIWDHLYLVIWKMDNGTWMHDALGRHQHVGQVQPATPEERERRLREALLHRSQW